MAEVLEAVDLDIKYGTLLFARMPDLSLVAASKVIEMMPQYALCGLDALLLGVYNIMAQVLL